MNSNTLILVNKVEKEYAKVKAVNKLSFRVEKGEIFALLGPNGAGKSSLVRMLVGFTQPDSGTIKVQLDGKQYVSIPAHQLGYLPEDRGLYGEKTVKQNLSYFAKLHGVDKKQFESEITYWLERFDLSERANDTLKSLSKGNQQKVQLISAVLHQPEVVILDEPFSGLDPINQEKVVQFLAELKEKGMTVILSAHQMAMVEKLADKMLLMNRGEIVLQGTIAQIREQIGVGAELKVSYQDPISGEHVKAMLTGYKYTLINESSLSLDLESNQQLSAVLQLLPHFGTVVTLVSHQVDLHQLYLKALAQHNQLTAHTSSIDSTIMEVTS